MCGSRAVHPRILENCLDAGKPGAGFRKVTEPHIKANWVPRLLVRNLSKLGAHRGQASATSTDHAENGRPPRVRSQGHWAAKVRNVSMPGSQFGLSAFVSGQHLLSSRRTCLVSPQSGQEVAIAGLTHFFCRHTLITCPGACRAQRATFSRTRFPVGARALAELGRAAALQATSTRSEKS